MLKEATTTAPGNEIRGKRIGKVPAQWILAGCFFAALILALRSGAAWQLRTAADGNEDPGLFQIHSPFAQQMTLRVNEVGTPWICHVQIFGSSSSEFTLKGRADSAIRIPFSVGPEKTRLKISVTDATTGASCPILEPKLSRSPIHTGNLRFLLAFSSVWITALAISRKLGIKGLNLWGAAPVIGFLLICATATILSLFHCLHAWVWTAILAATGIVSSLWLLRKRGSRVEEAHPEIGYLEILGVVLLFAPVLIVQITHPVFQWDDLMYHGSRAGYWMNLGSALPFNSHSERLSLLPLGGDLLFAFGAIMTRSEDAGKFLVVLAYPLCILAIHNLLLGAGVRRVLAFTAALVFATSPLVFAAGGQIKPDLWAVFFVVVALHWALHARFTRSTNNGLICCAISAASTAAMLGVKWTLLPAVVVLGIPVTSSDWHRRLAVICLVFAAAIALGGSGPNLIRNTLVDGHPLGSRGFRAGHQPDPGWHPIQLNMLRIPFVLFGVPMFPTDEAELQFNKLADALAEKMGAMERLPTEKLPWPGFFDPHFPTVDDRFSLGWLFAFFGMCVGALRFRQFRSSHERFAFGVSAALCILLLASIVIGMRWQPVGHAPERFLPPALAMGLMASALAIGCMRMNGIVPLMLLSACAALHALPFLHFAQRQVVRGSAFGWNCPPYNAPDLSISTLVAASETIPSGSNVLFFGEQGSRDYVLFGAREGFSNTVHPFDQRMDVRTVMETWIDSGKVDAVVFANAPKLDMNWDPPVDATPFILAMEGRHDFQRIPGTSPAVVFLRNSRNKTGIGTAN